jgi:chromate transporter
VIVLTLYLLTLKTVLLSLNGQSSIPLVRHEFVVERKLVTDTQLNAALTAGQTAPGPMGAYVVAIGYFVAGVPGALAAWLALLTPAFLAVPLMRFAGNRIENPRVRSSLDAVVIAGCGLILSTALPMAREAGVLGRPLPAAIAAGALVTVAFTRLSTVWVIVAGALLGAVVLR